MSELPTPARTAPKGGPAPRTPSSPRGNVSGFPGGSSAVSPLGLHGPGDPRGLAPERVSLVWLRGGDFKARGLSHGRVGVAAHEATLLFRLNPSVTSYSLQSPDLPSTVKALGSLPILTFCKAAVSQLPLHLLWAPGGPVLPFASSLLWPYMLLSAFFPLGPLPGPQRAAWGPLPGEPLFFYRQSPCPTSLPHLLPRLPAYQPLQLVKIRDPYPRRHRSSVC